MLPPPPCVQTAVLRLPLRNVRAATETRVASERNEHKRLMTIASPAIDLLYINPFNPSNNWYITLMILVIVAALQMKAVLFGKLPKPPN